MITSARTQTFVIAGDRFAIAFAERLEEAAAAGGKRVAVGTSSG